MNKPTVLVFICLVLLICQGLFTTSNGQEKLTINDQGYFEMPGLDIMVFDDYYPSGHQGGITIIQNGERVAANGDIRTVAWPEKGSKKVDQAAGIIIAQSKNPES
jgi:endoglucanase